MRSATGALRDIPSTRRECRDDVLAGDGSVAYASDITSGAIAPARSTTASACH